MKSSRGTGALIICFGLIVCAGAACGSDDSGEDAVESSSGSGGGSSTPGGAATPRAEGGVDFAVLGLRGATQDQIRDAYCKRYAEQLCAARASCCSEPSAQESSCASYVETSCYLDTSNGTRDGAVFSSERVQRVFDQLKRATDVPCGDYTLPQRPDPFAVVSVARGGNCADPGRYRSAQCEAGSNCVNSVCTEAVPAGGACSSTAQCAEGNVCGRTCVPIPAPAQLGQTCSLDSNCASGVCRAGACTSCMVDADCVSFTGIITSCVGGTCRGYFNACDDPPAYLH